MKQTLEYYLRQDEEFRNTLLAQGGGIMKYWAQHPDAEFDTDLFVNYEKQIVENYLLANKRNRSIASLSEDELKMKARSWIRHTEKEIHYKMALQPCMVDLPTEVIEQVNHYIDDYLADAYRDYRRSYYPNGITPLAFYDEVVKQFGSGGLARYCMDYILREHHHPEVWSKKKSENALMTEFFIQQYSETIGELDAYKMLRQAVKEKSAGKTPEECRHEAIKTMKLVKDFSQMIYSSTEVNIIDCTGHYKVDKDFLRNLASSETALHLLAHSKVPPLHECFFYYVSLLNDIGRIWAARLLKDCNIDMHELEKETGTILYPVTKPSLEPDGKDHSNYKYYVDKDFNDPLDDQCCIYDEKQAKDLLKALRKRKLTEKEREGSNNTDNLAIKLKESIKTFIDNLNNNPKLVTKLRNIVVKSRFDWTIIKSIISGIKEEWLMDKTIQLIVDTWYEYINKKDERCYRTIGYIPDNGFDGFGMYKKDQPMKMLKYIDIKRDLDGIKADELKRRKVNAKYEKELQKLNCTTIEKQRKPRKQVDVKTATHSFKIDISQIGAKEKTKRLSIFFADLARNGKYIQEDTNPDAFIKNYTGVHTGEKIVWTAEYKQLLYLIQKLHEAGVLSWNTEKPKPGIRQMICIVFRIRDFEYKEVEGKIDKVPIQCIHDIEIKNLNTSIDDSDEGLDPIIRRLLYGEESIDEGLTYLIKSESGT